MQLFKQIDRSLTVNVTGSGEYQFINYIYFSKEYTECRDPSYDKSKQQ